MLVRLFPQRPRDGKRMQVMITNRATTAAELRSCRRHHPQQVVGGGAGGSGVREPHARTPWNALQTS